MHLMQPSVVTETSTLKAEKGRCFELLYKHQTVPWNFAKYQKKCKMCNTMFKTFYRYLTVKMKTGGVLNKVSLAKVYLKGMHFLQLIGGERIETTFTSSVAVDRVFYINQRLQTIYSVVHSILTKIDALLSGFTISIG
jgi:hypothetical protein